MCILGLSLLKEEGLHCPDVVLSSGGGLPVIVLPVCILGLGLYLAQVVDYQ